MTGFDERISNPAREHPRALQLAIEHPKRPAEDAAEPILGRHRFSAQIHAGIRSLYELDNWHGLLAALLDHFLIFASAMLAERWPLLLPAALIVIGTRQRALATLLHEASHLSLARNRALGRFIGTALSGYLIFQTWASYKQSHVLLHHHYLGNARHDPDYRYYLSTGIYQAHGRAAFLRRYLWQPLLQFNLMSNLHYLLRHRLLANASVREALAMMLSLGVFAGIGGILVGWYFFFLYWLLPYLTVFQTVSWFIELAEHYPMLGTVRLDLQASRNRFGNAVENFLTGAHGERFHLIHHLFPRIPFWHMQRAHAMLLEDADYRALNATFGGIFSSATAAPALWRSPDFHKESP